MSNSVGEILFTVIVLYAFSFAYQILDVGEFYIPIIFAMLSVVFLNVLYWKVRGYGLRDVYV